MTNKHLHLSHSRLAFDSASLQPTDAEVQLILALRSLPASVWKALVATTHSQADHYRAKGRTGLQLIQGGAGKEAP